MVIARYVLREQIGPFFFSLVALTVVLLLNQLLKLMRYIVDKDLEPSVVGELFLLSLPFIIVLTIPMAVLLSSVLAFGRFTQDLELTAMKAAGMPLHRIMWPTVVVASLLCAGLILFQDRVLPDTNHRIRNLTADIARKKPTLIVEAGVVSEIDKNTRLRVEAVDHRTGELQDVRILDLRTDAPPINIVAPRGRMVEDGAGGIILDLFDGEIIEASADDKTELRRTHFKANAFRFQAETELQRTDSDFRGDRELSIGELQNRVRDSRLVIQEKLDAVRVDRSDAEWPPTRTESRRWERAGKIAASKAREVNRYRVEIHKKYAIAVACISFVMIGVPLGAIPKRGGNALGVIICLFLFIAHYVCLVGGERIADRGIVTPEIAMWFPDVLVTLAGAWLIYMNGHETLFLRLDWIEGARRWLLPKSIPRMYT
ncbi:MAG: hypothetical protein CME06_07200 [Gemmatimonadetes bacterium]|nr:hypothetical protein [Gemmatimonadota bacterium]